MRPPPAPSSHLLRASGFLQQVAQTFALAAAEVRPLFWEEEGRERKENVSAPPPTKALLYLSLLCPHLH